MFCLKCGKELKDGTKFCPYCGAATSAGGAAAPAGSAPEAPGYALTESGGTAANGKKRLGGAVAGGAVAAVLAVALIIAAVSGLFSSPKGQVEKALSKTVSAYAGVRSNMGLPDLSELIEGRSYSQRISLEMGSISQELTGWYDLSALKGLGVRVNTDYDQKARKMDADAALFWDGEDLASVQMLVDDAKISFASPDFTKGDAYGFNTETLGADLDRAGFEDDDVNVKKIGFNIFDLMDLVVPTAQQTKERKAAAAEAGKQLTDAIEVEKAGKESIQVNGKSMDATLYHVVVPKAAMKDYINAMEDVMASVDVTDVMKELLQAMGLDKSTVNEIMSEMGSAGVYGDMASMLKEVVKTLGDVELDVYVSGGYVSAVEYAKKLDGSKLEIGLYLGGGDNYVDDLSLEISADGDKLTVESSGDHAGKSGVFTDETTLRVDSSRITSELRYEPKASSGNLEWTLKVDNAASLQVEGQLTTTKNSIDLHLDDLSVKAAGSKLLSLGMDYYLGPCKGMTVNISSPKMIFDMSESERMDLGEDLEDNMEDWAYDMEDRIPAQVRDLLF